MKKKLLAAPAALIIALLFFGCFSPWKDTDTATITLNLSREGDSRSVSDETLSKLEYTIEFSGPTGTITRNHSGGGIIKVAVAPGHWDINVTAYEGKDQFALGSAGADILAGQNNPVTINMIVVPERWPEADRWHYYLTNSTATVEHFSVGRYDGQDNVCKVTIGGKVEPNSDEEGWNAWRVRIVYNYTAKPNTNYAFEFESWKEGDTERILHFQYYDDDAQKIYGEHHIELSNERTTYNRNGEIIKGGIRPLHFQCADQLGTFYIKMLRIYEYSPTSPELEFELINNAEIASNNGTYRVKSAKGMSGAVEIPATHNGRAVTEIGDYAFQDNRNITSVIISNSVNYIGWAAFEACTGLTGITIPASVTYIGGMAFSGCSQLASINVNQNNPEFSSETGILYSKDKKILLVAPGAISSAFSIPDNVIKIGQGAFRECKNLTSLNIHKDVEYINCGTFTGCTNLMINVDINNPNFSSDNGILFNNDKTELIAYPSARDQVTIPDTVKYIANTAFEGCINLTGVTIPDSVEYIGSWAFGGCTKVSMITIPASVVFIDSLAFNQWPYTFPYLQTIYIEGHANKQSTITAKWKEDWNEGCNARIVYSGIITFTINLENDQLALNKSNNIDRSNKPAYIFEAIGEEEYDSYEWKVGEKVLGEGAKIILKGFNYYSLETGFELTLIVTENGLTYTGTTTIDIVD